jgi:hypothetical protein
MSRRKPLAALAAVTAALALAVPVAGASATTTAPAVPTAYGVGIRLPAGSLPCRIGISELVFATRTGNTLFANYIARVLQYSGCGGAAI